MIVGSFEAHREAFGAEPICTVPRIASWTCYQPQRPRADPTRQPVRAQLDGRLRSEIARDWRAHWQVYGALEEQYHRTRTATAGFDALE